MNTGMEDDLLQAPGGCWAGTSREKQLWAFSWVVSLNQEEHAEGSPRRRLSIYYPLLTYHYIYMPCILLEESLPFKHAAFYPMPASSRRRALTLPQSAYV